MANSLASFQYIALRRIIHSKTTKAQIRSPWHEIQTLSIIIINVTISYIITWKLRFIQRGTKTCNVISNGIFGKYLEEKHQLKTVFMKV